MQSKAASYLGLARRAGKLTLGVNALATVKKCYLIAVDPAASENSQKEIKKQQRRLNCPLVFLDGLGEAVGKSGCMVAAVREEHLAGAIEKEIGQENSERKSENRSGR